MQLMVTNDKDHLCTQVSYRLNLRGPSVAVQTTCSTSLVAVSLACESLHGGPLRHGARRRRDGARAAARRLLLHRRIDPVARRPLPAVRRQCAGHDRRQRRRARRAQAAPRRRSPTATPSAPSSSASGLNNDGSDKAGYTAPSSAGQAAAIRAAHAMAGVTPESIGYVEAHGTGTILGDPIEISALTEVFTASTDRRGFCGIGSVKSNFGHLSCAAGVAGLIKTVLALEHGAIPPTVHYTTPNPAIDFASSPFYVTTRLQPWERNGTPRRAGVSSFGVGGTNAHLVLEEAPQRRCRARSDGARTSCSCCRRAARRRSTRRPTRLATHLEAHPELDLADVAYTLHVGRRAFRHRRPSWSAATTVRRSSRRCASPSASPAAEAAADRPVVFMFSGQGSQYPGMAAGLYTSEPVVRRDGRPLRAHARAGARRRPAAACCSRRRGAERGGRGSCATPRCAQPALFIVELRAGRAVAVVGRRAGGDDRPQRRRVRGRHAGRRDDARGRAAADRAPRAADVGAAARDRCWRSWRRRTRWSASSAARCRWRR